MKSKSLWVPNADIGHRIFDSGLAGPTVVITAGIHGDELTGIGACRQLLTEIPDVLCKGRIHVFPCLNPGGVAHRMRHFPGTRLDINRSFPGNPSGSPSERHAWAFWERMSEDRPTLLIDLHADSAASIPYTIVDRDLSKKDPSLSQACHELAKATGLFTLWEYPEHDYRRYGLMNSLAGAVVNEWQRMAITIELGPRGRLDSLSVGHMIKSIFAALAFLDMVDSSYRLPPSVLSGHWTRQNGPSIQQNALFEPVAPLGVLLQPGTLLGIAFSPMGVELERVSLAKESLVLSYPSSGFLKAGQACASLAVPEI